MSKQPEWVKDMARAVGTGMIREIVADNRAGGRSPRPEEARPNVAVTVPFAKDPPGYDVITKLLDAQDARDRADRLIEAAKRRAALQQRSE